MKLGLLGGTFNPIHLAHLRIAEEAREGAGLERVLFIPAADPPHKPLAGEIPFVQRYEMAQLAVTDNPAFEVSDIEARRPGKSYTVETLPALRAERPGDEFYFIIGSDSYLELGLWHRYSEIFPLTSLVVLTRPGQEIDEPLQRLPEPVRRDFQAERHDLLRHKSGTVIRFIQGAQLDISSSRLRELAGAGRSLRYLVPPSVETYIAQKGLYRS